jgi:hypothetical protein
MLPPKGEAPEKPEAAVTIDHRMADFADLMESVSEY